MRALQNQGQISDSLCEFMSGAARLTSLRSSRSRSAFNPAARSPIAKRKALLLGGPDAPAIDPTVLDTNLRSHLIDPALLRSDAFELFLEDRQTRLLRLIEEATGRKIRQDSDSGESADDETDVETLESELTMEPAE